MEREWDGYRRQHLCRDRYRVVWTVLYDAAIYVERIGPRATVYDRPPHALSAQTDPTESADDAHIPDQ